MGKAISHVQGKGSISHNNREFFSANVDPLRTKDNVIFVNEPIADAYHKLFDGAVAEFNAKQKRNDRKKNPSYFVDLFNREPCQTVVTAPNKENSFYEDVVQIGKMEDTSVGTADAEVAKKCLIEYMNGFQKRNPQFHVFNAVLHMDEATPHLHIDYIPVATGYKTGLSVRNGLAKALEQMGYGNNKDNISKWREAERIVFRQICEKHGIEVSEEKKDINRRHYDVPEYKEIKGKCKKLNEEAENLDNKIVSLKDEYEKYSNITINADKLIGMAQKKTSAFSKKTTYTFSEEDFSFVSEQLRAAAAMQSQKAEIDAHSNELNNKQIFLSNYEDELKEKDEKIKEIMENIEKIKAESEAEYQRNKNSVEQLKKAEIENQKLNEEISELKLENKVISQIREEEYRAMANLETQIYNENKEVVQNLKKEYNTEIEKLKKDISNLRTMLFSAIDFIKNTCKSINMMIDKKENDYTISESSSNQRSLLEAVKEYGISLLHSMGLKKEEDEAKNIVELPDKIEEIIEENNEQNYSRGGMTR